MSECLLIKLLLAQYVQASGQLVNFHKSAVCVSGLISRPRAISLVATLGVRLVDCHEKYLGLPSFVCRNKRTLFANIKDRIWGLINGWRGHLFSSVGKEILLKVVIQTIPTYAMTFLNFLRG
ncbi:hypothetical protein ACOSQ4_023803 [Xanthoceras sorbifolium]